LILALKMNVVDVVKVLVAAEADIHATYTEEKVS
jgi:hypothetical protein